MKKLFILLLCFSLSCEKQNSTTTTGATAESSSPATTTIPNTAPLPLPSTSYSTDSWTEQLIELINNHRTSIGLRALILDDGLSQIVIDHSLNMAIGTIAFGHTGFSIRCRASYDILGGGNWCAENVAMGQKTPEAAYTAWMNSPVHRANIESGKGTHTGLGYAKSLSGTYYWTQIFIQR